MTDPPNSPSPHAPLPPLPPRTPLNPSTPTSSHATTATSQQPQPLSQPQSQQSQPQQLHPSQQQQQPPLPLHFPVYPPTTSVPPFQYPYPYSQYLPPIYSLPTWPSNLPPPPLYSWTPPHTPPPLTPPPPDPRLRRKPDPPQRPPRHRQPSPSRRRPHDSSPRRHYGQDHDDDDPDSTTSTTPHHTPRISRTSRGKNKQNHAPASPLAPAAPSPSKPPREDVPKDPELASAELDRAARKAVEGADDVTLALLLMSWANSLEEAGHVGGGSAGEFEAVFHGSNALEIVVSEVLMKEVGSEVRKALLHLLAFVLYGQCELHHRVVGEVEKMGAIGKEREEGWRRARDGAVRKVLSFLSDLRMNVRAYCDVLPGGANGKGGAGGGAGPAGPDPTKAVERSMDAWRRAMARLQGEMAIVIVLKKALKAVEIQLRSEEDLHMHENVEEFYKAVRDAVSDCIVKDVERRKEVLNKTYWVDVTLGADSTVFAAAKSNAQLWLSQFEAARSEVESQLDDAGIGFGPAARVLEDKFSVLVAASAGVAALVSRHQHAFSWSKHVGNLLSSMMLAFHSLERVSCSEMGPPEALKKSFLKGVEDTFAAIDDIVNWSFASLHEKVLGSLEKSIGFGNASEGNTLPQKSKLLRFEEPPKTDLKDGDSTDGIGTPAQSRRKPRHARMKSSPDALLHLNAHMDDYPITETDVDRELDREIDTGEEKSNLQIVSPTTESFDQNGTYEAVDGESNTGELSPRGEDELRTVPEGSPLEYDEDEEDPDDDEIIVHDNVEDAARPKKVGHTSRVRSMSVDGIPF